MDFLGDANRHAAMEVIAFVRFVVWGGGDIQEYAVTGISLVGVRPGMLYIAV